MEIYLPRFVPRVIGQVGTDLSANVKCSVGHWVDYRGEGIRLFPSPENFRTVSQQFPVCSVGLTLIDKT